nr:hypothetical protein Iba_chr07dCG6860 [Ipomoea batatas]
MAYPVVLSLRLGLEDLLHLMIGKWSESYLERIKSRVCFIKGVLKVFDPEKTKVFEDSIRNLAREKLVQFAIAHDLGNEPKETSLVLPSSSSNLCAKNAIVGLDTDLLRIKEHLIGLPLKLSAMSIVANYRRCRTVVRLRQFLSKEFLVMATLENFQQQLCNSNRAILMFLLHQFQSGRQQVCSSAAKNFLGACEFILV